MWIGSAGDMGGGFAFYFSDDSEGIFMGTENMPGYGFIKEKKLCEFVKRFLNAILA